MFFIPSRLPLLLIPVLMLNALGETAISPIDLCDAVVVVEGRRVPEPVQVAATVLVEEVAKRTGCEITQAKRLPVEGTAIALDLQQKGDAGLEAEGYRISVDRGDKLTTIRITGADPRGVLFGVGHLLRRLDWREGAAQLPPDIQTVSAPMYAIRGHQLGYRARANSYDAWDAATYDQYIRELALFGTNCIENIPFQDEDPSPHMPLTRPEMNRVMSEICAKYDLDYWVWTPADFDLKDARKRTAALRAHGAFYHDCPRLDAVFFPGGDPGDNHPSEVMPFLKDIAQILHAHHPKAQVWMSLQGFNQEQVDYFYSWLAESKPKWFTGVVAGPSSPPIAETRQRLPRAYGLRHYPDITHVVRAEYPILWLDQAFALTLGRECINPTPLFQRLLHNNFAPDTDGFLSYSDGIHDDVNKIIWSSMAWNSEMPARDILVEYCRLFFGPEVEEDSVDAILALEKNWEGPLAVNGGVTATLGLWERLESRAPELAKNWRWQMCLMRANYDAYTRYRLLYEQELERQANALLDPGRFLQPEDAMSAALAVVQQADTEKTHPELRERVVQLCENLYKSIGLQTSVEKYKASGSERGASLDFLDYPLNNRWWLEDEFKRIRAVSGADTQWERLIEIRDWEEAGPGGFYDDIGNVANSPHTVRGQALNTVPAIAFGNIPTFWWWDNGYSRQRLSWQVSQDWPDALQYNDLDPNAHYHLRMTGYGEAFVRADGERLTPGRYEKEIGGIKEFSVPKQLTADRKLTVTFDRPEESQLNWRQQSRLAEVWLIRQE
ncbi:MAG: hypothetical protein HYV26_07570 [Candidatus Hydrogenedentes bacterium]|nr:hypothetical protein [Candidatus Hydrogenedentota bacterium]